MSNEKFETPVDRLKYWAQTKPNEVYLTQPVEDQVIEYTWSQVLHEVSCMASYLTQYPQGSHVAIISLNCAHWIMADLAIQMAGHVSIPIYPTASGNTIGKILKHSEAKAVFIGKMFEPEHASAHVPADLLKIAIYQPRPQMPFWTELVESNQVLESPNTLQPNDLLSIIYTSGTTGDPKGVMISYRALFAAMELVKSVILINQQDRFVSYLPLAHVAERMAVEYGSLYHGAHVSFIRSLETFTEDVKTARPTIFFGVPRIWSKIKSTIEHKLGGSKVLHVLMKIPVLGHWLRQALLKKLGFQDVRFALCAAAAINKDVLDWYQQLGLKLNEAYGMSETCGLSHMTKQTDTCTGSVGRVIEGCECRLSEAGEVLLRNPAMMDGYYKQPELTAQTIDSEGWLHTGDLGEIDASGFLFITGRVKDIFKTSKGKYIAPSPIEQSLQSLLDMEQLILMGDGFAQPFVVIVTAESRYAEQPKELVGKAEQVIQQINTDLESHERISHVFISAELWSPDNGLLTPTLKMKRVSIEKHYHQKVKQAMAATDQRIIILPNEK